MQRKGTCMEIIATAHVREAISRLGRTEDIRFSPDNSRVAIASYGGDACFLFDIEVDRSACAPIIRITDYLEIRSTALRKPHGLDFIGERLLVVANRAGGGLNYSRSRNATQESGFIRPNPST